MLRDYEIAAPIECLLYLNYINVYKASGWNEPQQLINAAQYRFSHYWDWHPYGNDMAIMYKAEYHDALNTMLTMLTDNLPALNTSDAVKKHEQIVAGEVKERFAQEAARQYALEMLTRYSAGSDLKYVVESLIPFFRKEQSYSDFKRNCRGRFTNFENTQGAKLNLKEVYRNIIENYNKLLKDNYYVIAAQNDNKGDVLKELSVYKQGEIFLQPWDDTNVAATNLRVTWCLPVTRLHKAGHNIEVAKVALEKPATKQQMSMISSLTLSGMGLSTAVDVALAL
jgi:hypothetical protein